MQKPTRIIPDEGTNSLIVATVEKNVKPLQELIELLDGVPSAEDVEVKLFPLRFADAESVRDTLREMFDGGKVLPEDPDGSGANAVPEGPYGHGLVYNIGLYADTRTNTLVFTGRPEQALLVEKIVNELDRPAVALKFPLHLIRLEYSDATRIAQVITKLFDQRFEALEATNAGNAALERERLFLSVDIQSNSLLVSASQENYRELFTITRQLDTQPTQRLEHIRIIMCERLAARDLKEKIDELWARKSTLRGEAELLDDQPIIVADDTSNTLIVRASAGDFGQIQRLIETLDTEATGDQTTFTIIAVAEGIPVATLADTVQTTINEGERIRAQRFPGMDAGTLIATPDLRSGTVILAGSPSLFADAEKLIRSLERMGVSGGTTTRIIRPTNRSPEEISRLLQQVIDQNTQSKGGGRSVGRRSPSRR